MDSLHAASFTPGADTPLYQQLYLHLRRAILSGELKGGTKLPSTRALADDFNLSRNTVLTAYRQLTAEGYLEGVEGSGSFVVHVLPEELLTASKSSAAKPIEATNKRPLNLSKHARVQLRTAMRPPMTAPRPFSSDSPALNEFPYDVWSRLIVRQARRMAGDTFRYQESAGYRPLREAIAAHVAVTRQVHCSPDQVVIVSGSQGALDLCARMLLNAEDQVWLEEPGYIGARGALVGVGAKIVPVPVDLGRTDRRRGNPTCSQCTRGVYHTLPSIPVGIYHEPGAEAGLARLGKTCERLYSRR